jgi:hypothetical protein
MAEISDPVQHAAAVTPSDTANLPAGTTALYIGVTGNVQVTMMDGTVVIFSNFPVGWQPIRVIKVWATNTTATNLVAVWQ